MLVDLQSHVDDQPGAFLGSFFDFANKKIVVVTKSSFASGPAEVRGGIARAIEGSRDRAVEDEQAVDALIDGGGSDLSPDEAKALANGAADSIDALRTTDPTDTLRIEVRPACRSDVDLQEIEDEAKALFLSYPDATKTSSLGVSIDAAESTVEVSLTNDLSEIGNQLERRHGESVVVRYVDPAPTLFAGGRLQDTSAHYGGARLITASGGSGCTSGFAADRSSGRFLVTAGHCDPSMSTYFNNNVGGYIGNPYHIAGNYPTRDVMLVGSALHQYSRTVWTGTSAGGMATRLVAAKANTAVGDTLCASGSYTFRKCNGVVWITNYDHCGYGALGCGNNLKCMQRF